MKCDVSLINRLKRTQGQIGGVVSMMENEALCVDILTQLKAIRSSVDKAIGLLTANNLVQTIEETHNIKLENLHEAINLILKGK